MRTTRVVAVSLIAAFALAPCRVAVASADEPVAFDGNAGSPDQRAGLEQVQINGTQTENVRDDPASWRIGPAGDARWSEALEVVPGINGLQPSIGVEYNSQADNGLIGQGFALTGLPAIVRVHGTGNGVTAEGEPRGVHFDDHDSFAIAPGGWGTPVSMSGRLVAGAGGATSYHTAIESWSQFVPYGNCGQASFAPCSWVGEDGRGNTYYYGASQDGRLWERAAGHDANGVPVQARGVMAWALTHVQDMHGNLYRVKYFSDDFMLYPERIEYGCPMTVPSDPPAGPPGDLPDPEMTTSIGFDPGDPTDAPFATTTEILGVDNQFNASATTAPTTVTITVGGTPPTPCEGMRVVRFAYETRPDITPMPHRYVNRLQSVSMSAGGENVRSYHFDYEAAPSPSWGRSRLDQLRRVGSDQISQHEPVTFTWSDGTMLVDAQQTRTWQVEPGEPVTTLSADINGDGNSDVLRVAFGTDRRRVTWALGQAGSTEPGQAPLGPTSMPLDRPGDHSEWSAAVADIDADGRDDLLLWTLHNGAGELQVHRGGPSGLLPVEHYVDNGALAGFAQIDARPRRDMRMLVADVNGDQVDDLVFVNRHPADVDRIAYALGASDGMGGLQVLSGASLAVTGSPALLEPMVNDIDGDGIDDVIVSYSKVTGITSQVFRGKSDGLTPGAVLAWAQSVDDAACPGSCNGSSECACNGVTPFQTLRTDINGDGIGDVTLAYSGGAVPLGQSGSVPTPFGRNVQTWLGQGDVGALPQDPAGRLVDASLRQIVDATSYPGIDYGAPNYAYWEHHSGDVNGDGFSDVVAVYSGAEGLRVGYAVGTPNGALGPMTTITQCASSALDPGWGDPCDPEPDGDVEVHRWHSLLMDYDGDGRSDLLRYYAGANGRNVEIAFGGPTGLGSLKPILSATAVPESTPTDQANARSVQLLVVDLNGDRAKDLVLATQDEIVLLPALPAPEESEESPDLLVQVDNGYGGSVSFEYAMAARLAGAIDPDATACGNASGEDCGKANRAPRPLTTRVVVGDGRGGELGTRYRYGNGRYYPGPVVVTSAGVRPHARADLAFEWVEHTAEQTGYVVRTHYYQDPALKRLPRTIEEYAMHYPAGGGTPGLHLARRKTLDYQRSPSPFNTQKVQLVHEHQVAFEWGLPGAEVEHDYDYGTFGGLERELECADNVCIETHRDYANPAITPGHYRVQRLLAEKSHEQASDLVIHWKRHHYAGDLLNSVDELLCGDAHDCWCYDDADDCIANGSGDWVATQHGLSYDAYGNVEARRDARNTETRIEYDTQYHTYASAMESDVEDAGGTVQTHRTERTYDDAGRVLTRTDFNGNVTTQHYDALGRRTSIEHPNGRQEAWDYEHEGDPDAQLVRYRELVDANQGVERYEERLFDGQGRPHTLRVSADGNVVERYLGQRFEDDHRIVLQSDPRFSTDIGPTMWTETILDPRDRPVEVNRVRGGDSQGGGTFLGTLVRRIYNQNGYSESRNMAPVGDDGVILGEDWTSTVRSFGSRRQLLSVLQPGGVRTDYFYDDARRLETVWGPHAGASTGPIMAEQFVQYSYDTLGRERIVNDSEGWTVLDYDATGNIIGTWDAAGNSNAYTYDAWGRMLTRTTSAGVETFAYDQFLNGVGQLCAVSGPWGSEIMLDGFDPAGNPHARHISLAGLAATQVETYEYRSDGRVTVKHLPDGSALEYRYDDAGELVEVALDGVTYLELDQFDAQGNPGLRVTPASLTTYDYNADGRLLELRAESMAGGDPFMEYAYSYDAAGNVLGVVDNRADTMVDATDTNDTWSFAYDARGQLTAATDHQGTATSYSYDESTNLTSRGSLSYTYGPTTVDVEENGTPVLHADLDPMGRVKTKQDAEGEWKYKHDPLGRLTATWLDTELVAASDYDATGRRTRTTETLGGVDVTTWYVSPNYELRESSNDPGTVVATRIVDAQGHGVVATLTADQLVDAPDEGDVLAAWADPLVVGHAGGAPVGVYVHHQNHINSTSVVTDAGGKVVTYYRTNPWGERRSDSVGFDVAYREFTGQVRDEPTKLVYYGARHYDPVLARFLEPDADAYGLPLFPDSAEDPASLNRHVYVKNNPVRYTDPTGHTPHDPVKAALDQIARMDDLGYFEPTPEPEPEPEQNAAMKWLNEKWKGWFGEDSKVKTSTDFKVGQHKFSMKNFMTSPDWHPTGYGYAYKPPVEVQAGPFKASGSLSVDDKGRPKLKLAVGPGVGIGKVGKASVQGFVEAMVNGDGVIKITPGLQATLGADLLFLNAEVKIAGTLPGTTIDLKNIPLRIRNADLLIPHRRPGQWQQLNEQ